MRILPLLLALSLPLVVEARNIQGKFSGHVALIEQALPYYVGNGLVNTSTEWQVDSWSPLTGYNTGNVAIFTASMQNGKLRMNSVLKIYTRLNGDPKSALIVKVALVETSRDEQYGTITFSSNVKVVGGEGAYPSSTVGTGSMFITAGYNTENEEKLPTSLEFRAEKCTYYLTINTTNAPVE